MGRIRKMIALTAVLGVALLVGIGCESMTEPIPDETPPPQPTPSPEPTPTPTPEPTPAPTPTPEPEPETDLNGDGEVNEDDARLFTQSFGAMEGDADYLMELDFDGDGEINFVDFQIWSDLIAE